ncbi:hypothetical protein ACFLRF_02200 [Candidatus Altiarchaeota archaeon]
MVSTAFSGLFTEDRVLSLSSPNTMTLEDVILLGAILILSFVFAAVASMVIKLLFTRQKEGNDWIQLSEQDNEVPQRPVEQAAPAPEPVRELSPLEKLKEREAELKARDEEARSEKMIGLETRERQIREKEGVHEPQAIVMQGQSSSQAPHDLPGSGERERILKLLNDAEKKFADGQMSERNYQMIAEDYHKRLISLDVKGRKAQDSGGNLIKE